MNKEPEKEAVDFFTATRKELEQYVSDRLLLLKMQGTEKAGKVMASLVFFLVAAMLFFFLLLFLGLMAGFYFGILTDNLYIGFGIVSIFYILMIALLVIFRRKLERKLMDTVIRIIFDKEEDEDDEDDE